MALTSTIHWQAYPKLKKLRAKIQIYLVSGISSMLLWVVMARHVILVRLIIRMWCMWMWRVLRVGLVISLLLLLLWIWRVLRMRDWRSRWKRDSLWGLTAYPRAWTWGILLIGTLWSWRKHRLLCWHVRVWGWLLGYWRSSGGRLRGRWTRKRPCSRHWHWSGWHTLLSWRFRLFSSIDDGASTAVIQCVLLCFTILLHFHHLCAYSHPSYWHSILHNFRKRVLFFNYI